MRAPVSLYGHVLRKGRGGVWATQAQILQIRVCVRVCVCVPNSVDVRMHSYHSVGIHACHYIICLVLISSNDYIFRFQMIACFHSYCLSIRASPH